MPNKKSDTSPGTVRARAKSASGRETRKPAALRSSATFALFAPNAQRVDVSGSFNGWDLKPMKKGKDGTWKVNLRPKPGRYEYKFIVDHQWIVDPTNPESVIDENGNINSVIEL